MSCVVEAVVAGVDIHPVIMCEYGQFIFSLTMLCCHQRTLSVSVHIVSNMALDHHLCVSGPLSLPPGPKLQPIATLSWRRPRLQPIKTLSSGEGPDSSHSNSVLWGRHACQEAVKCCLRISSTHTQRDEGPGPCRDPPCPTPPWGFVLGLWPVYLRPASSLSPRDRQEDQGHSVLLG